MYVLMYALVKLLHAHFVRMALEKWLKKTAAATTSSNWKCKIWDNATHVELKSHTSQPVDFQRCVYSSIAPDRPDAPDKASTQSNYPAGHRLQRLHLFHRPIVKQQWEGQSFQVTQMR